MTVERATRNAGWVFGLFLLRKAIRIGYLAAFARILEEQGFGSYYFLLTLATMLAVISFLGLNLFLVRHLHRKKGTGALSPGTGSFSPPGEKVPVPLFDKETDPAGFVSRCFGMNLTSSIVMTGMLLVVAPFTSYPRDVRLGMCLMGLSVVPISLTALLHSVSMAREKLFAYAVLENATPLAEAAVGLVLLLKGFGLVSLCALHLAVSTAYAVAFYLITQARIMRFGISFDWRAWLGYLRESWQIWTFSIVTMLYMYLPVVTLSALSGNNSEVGYFGAAMALVEAVRAGGLAFQSAVFPYAVRAWHRDPGELRGFHESFVRLLLVLGVPLGLLTWVLAAPVISIVFGHRYEASVAVLQVLAWLVFPLLHENVSVQVCYASEHSLLPVVGHGTVGAVRIALSVALVLLWPAHPAQATAWAMLASSLAAFALYTLLIRRYVYAFDPFGALTRTAAAAALPVLLCVLAMGRLNPFLLGGLVFALFAGGVFVFRCLGAREFEIIRRAAASLWRRAPSGPSAEQLNGAAP